MRARWLVIILVAVTLWGLLDVRRRGYPYPETPFEHKTDLTVYTEAGAAFFDGRNPYEVSNPRGWTYLYPPMFALLLAPLHVLPMQDQVTVWFFISLLFCWGIWRECRRILKIVFEDDPNAAAAWARWAPWIAVAAVVAATLPTLNCLQRGQVGIVKLYLLLLGLRLVLGRTYRGWLAGGIVLALSVVLKIVPALPVGFLIFLVFVDFTRSYWKRSEELILIGRRWLTSSFGVVLGLFLFFLLIPAMLVGWNNNLHHLDTWGQFMLTKAHDGGMDPRSGNSHSARNQSLQNAAYRLGNFGSHVFADGPDDRLVETFTAPKMAMDSPEAERCLLMSRIALTLALLAMGVRLARSNGDRMNLATGFALSLVTMLAVSPVARGHYFLLFSPAILLLPLWFDRIGRPRVGMVLAAIPPVICVLHYALLPYAGRIGFLGMGTAAWLLAALALMARADHSADAQHPSVQASPRLPQPSLRKAA